MHIISISIHMVLWTHDLKAVQELEIIELASNTGMSGTTGTPLVAGGGVHVVAGAGAGAGGGAA